MWLYSHITFSVHGGSAKKQKQLHLEDVIVLMVWSLSKGSPFFFLLEFQRQFKY